MNTKDRTIAFTMFLAGISCYGLLYYYQPMLPLLVKSFNVSVTESSFAVSFSTLGMTIGLLVGMFFSDSIGRKKLFSTTLFLGAVLALLSSFANTFAILILFCALKGIFLAGTASVSFAYINEEVSKESKSRVTGLYVAGGALGGMSARVIAGYLGSVFSWMWASIIIATIGLIFASIIFVKSPYSTNFVSRKKTFKILFYDNIMLLTNKYLLAYCSIGAVMIGIFVSLYNYVSFVLLSPAFALPKIYVSNIYFLFIFGLFGSVLTHKLLAHLKPHKLLRLVLLTTAFGLILLLLNSLYFIVLGLVFVTISFFIAHVVCSYIISNIQPSHRSIAISVYLLLYYTCSSIFGSATGFLLDNWDWIGLVGSLLACVAILLGITIWIGKNGKGIA